MKDFYPREYQQVLIDAIKRESYLPTVKNVHFGNENHSPRMTFDVHMPHDRGSIKSSATASFGGYQNEWRQKTADEVRHDMLEFCEQATKRLSEPMPAHALIPPTYEEISAYLHRAVNPTPADRAAATLNGEESPHGPLRYPSMVLLRGI